MDNWIFGCDVCQDVCPWNRFSKEHQEPLLKSQNGLLSYTETDWQEMTEVTFNLIFKQSAIKRTKFKGIKRNIAFIKSSI